MTAEEGRNLTIEIVRDYGETLARIMRGHYYFCLLPRLDYVEDLAVMTDETAFIVLTNMDFMDSETAARWLESVADRVRLGSHKRETHEIKPEH